MLKVYLDESGTHEAALVTVVAGYAIQESEVALLEREWLDALARHGLRELHMREFVPPYGKHATWTDSDRRALLEPLIALIHKRSLVGIGAALHLDEFTRAIQARSHKKVPELVESAYEWCFRYCTAQAAAFADKREIDGAIDYVLDQGCFDRHCLERAFHRSKESAEIKGRFRLGEIAFRDSEGVPALQCADLLAYEMYKEADRVISDSHRKTRKSFLALFRDEDRLVTVKPSAVKRQITRGANLIQAQVSLLPPKERFQVTCYGLRSLTNEQREIIFGLVPHYREIYDRCLATGETGMRLADVPRELVIDDPKIIFPLVGLAPDGTPLKTGEGNDASLNLDLHGPFDFEQ
jgi:hypothetical protein